MVFQKFDYGHAWFMVCKSTVDNRAILLKWPLVASSIQLLYTPLVSSRARQVAFEQEGGNVWLFGDQAPDSRWRMIFREGSAWEVLVARSPVTGRTTILHSQETLQDLLLVLAATRQFRRRKSEIRETFCSWLFMEPRPYIGHIYSDY